KKRKSEVGAKKLTRTKSEGQLPKPKAKKRSIVDVQSADECNDPVPVVLSLDSDEEAFEMKVEKLQSQRRKSTGSPPITESPSHSPEKQRSRTKSRPFEVWAEVFCKC